MGEEDVEEFRLKERAKKEMEERGVDWVAYPTNYDAKKNLSLCKNISAWYGMSACPATHAATQKSGLSLTSAEFRDCLPRPDKSEGIIIAIPKHPLMEAYLKGWAASDGKRNRTRQREILQYVEYGVITADQATLMLELSE